MSERDFIVDRHNLDYNKLYHMHGGGYSMDKLKKVLKRIRTDRGDGLHQHPWLDPVEADRLDQKLRSILKLDGKDEAADGEEGQDQEEAASNSEDEGAPKKKMSFGEEVMDAMNQAVASEDVDGQKFRRAVHELV